MFMRKKGECYYLVENHRINGKVRQKVCACLGRSGDIADTLAAYSTSLTRERARLGRPERRKRKRDNSRRKARRMEQMYLEAERELGFTLLQFASSAPAYSHLSTNDDIQKFKKDDWVGYLKLMAAYNTDKNARIKPLLVEKPKPAPRTIAQRIAVLETKLANLWAVVPEAERSEMQADVTEKVAENERQMAEWLAGFMKLTRRVVPENVSRKDNSGTTFTGFDDVAHG